MYISMSKEKNENLKKKETMDLHILTTRLSDYMVLLRHVHPSGQIKEREFEKEKEKKKQRIEWEFEKEK